MNIKSHKNQLRYFNSFYPKKIKQNIFNKIANEQILTTISNDFRNNKKIEIFKNINSNIDLNQNKYNLSDKKYKREKSSSKNKELSLNLTTENYIKNLLAFKKLRNLKNKNFKSSDFNNENNNINNNIKKENLTTRIKIDLINVEKNNAKKYVTRNNNIINSNNETIHTTVNSNSLNSNKYKKIKKIYLDNTTYKALPYKCVSPNCQSIKKIMDGKKNVSKLKQIYNNKLKPNNKGRNNYNIYFSSNNSRCAGNSNNFLANTTMNSNNVIFFKKLQKESLKNNKYSNNNSNIVNYNLENLSNYSLMNKKIIVFNNVNNFNISNSNNTISEITNIKYGKNNQYVSQKTHEDLGNCSSIFNQSYYKNRKKIIINTTPNCHKKNNSKIKSNIGLLEQNIIHFDNPYIKSSSNNKTFNIINNTNRHQINKNMIYKLNKNNNFIINNALKQLKYNNNNQISISNDKEKKILKINHNSCANLNLNKNKKSFQIKNRTIEASGKISKNHSKKSIMAL